MPRFALILALLMGAACVAARASPLRELGRPLLHTQPETPADHRLETSPAAGAGVVRAVHLASPSSAVEEGEQPVGQTASPGPPLPLTPARTDAALPLDRAGDAQRVAAGSSGLPPLATALGSLAIVLGLFLGTAWLLRRGMPAAGLALPAEVVDVLGRARLPCKQPVYLVRCGRKLLLVWVSAQGVKTLTEITDDVEVDRLAGICREAHPASASTAFRQIFQQFANEPSARGFLESASRDEGGRGRGGGRAAEPMEPENAY